MKNKEAQNCWEFWDCKVKKDCYAYKTDSGRECWFISSRCPRINQGKPGVPKVDQGFEYCGECPWYQKLNPEKKK
ncbi:hypothetical protein KKG22_01360 [Patescibacteria group bacterium]|nr:hypothetical protein [Patescibacteria group bacterium]MBU1721742.1 hypothetical protein [Patescibacteria group bacterium]MBU1901419.1 hypothetical protein [Patescibacteria group bacterium]